MPRLVCTSVVARLLGVSSRSVLRYIECGLIHPAACRRNPGARGHHRIDLDEIRGLKSWFEENRTNRTAPQEDSS